MPEAERAELISHFADVDEVVITTHGVDDLDKSVSRELARIRPHVFANGGDRKNEEDIPESVICRELNIEMVFNVGQGGKVQSSSWLTNKGERP